MTTPAWLRRLVAVGLGALLPLLITVPAFAGTDDGEVKGASLGTGMVILIFVVIPLGAFAVIGFFSALPSMLKRPRYRPGRPWSHEPLWFNGPDDANAAVASARPGGAAKGGANAEW